MRQWAASPATGALQRLGSDVSTCFFSARRRPQPSCPSCSLNVLVLEYKGCRESVGRAAL
jgi:hypothetical protein